MYVRLRLGVNNYFIEEMASSSNDTSNDKLFESMKKFKKYIPFLKIHEEKLQKKLKLNDNKETQMKLSCVEKYLQIIRCDTSVPINLANRMECALEEMMAPAIKNEEKKSDDEPKPHDHEETKESNNLEPIVSNGSNDLVVEACSKADDKQEPINNVNSSTENELCEETPLAIHDIAEKLNGEPLDDDTDLNIEDPYENCVPDNDKSSPAVDKDANVSFNPIIENCESISHLDVNSLASNSSEICVDNNVMSQSDVISDTTELLNSDSAKADEGDNCFINDDAEVDSAANVSSDQTIKNVNILRDILAPNNTQNSDLETGNDQSTDQPSLIDADWDVENTSSLNSFNCPECPVLKSMTFDELKSHLYEHSCQQQCCCNSCNDISNDGAIRVTDKFCTKNEDLDLKISDILADILSAKSAKRKMDDEGLPPNKKARLAEEAQCDVQENGCTEEVEMQHNITDKIKSLKKRIISVSSEFSSQNDLGVSNFYIKTENDPLMSSVNPMSNAFPGMENYGAVANDNGFAINVDDIKVEQSSYFNDYVENGLDSTVNNSSVASDTIPVPKTGKNTARKSSGPTKDFLPYECSFCGSCYRSLSTYRSHTYKHFKDYYLYRCGYCNKGFMRKDYFKGHMLSLHPLSESKLDQIAPPEDPIIILVLPNTRPTPGVSPSRLEAISEIFKCALCEFTCVPAVLEEHFKAHHDGEVPQMKMLKECFNSNISFNKSTPFDPKPTKKKGIARKSTAAKASPIANNSNKKTKKNVALKSTAKKSQSSFVHEPSIQTSSDNESQPFKNLKIWSRSRSIYLPVKDLMKMINLNCSVRLSDLRQEFF